MGIAIRTVQIIASDRNIGGRCIQHRAWLRSIVSRYRRVIRPGSTTPTSRWDGWRTPCTEGDARLRRPLDVRCRPVPRATVSLATATEVEDPECRAGLPETDEARRSASSQRSSDGRRPQERAANAALDGRLAANVRVRPKEDILGSVTRRRCGDLATPLQNPHKTYLARDSRVHEHALAGAATASKAGRTR
jgi:hypothetical protein